MPLPAQLLRPLGASLPLSVAGGGLGGLLSGVQRVLGGGGGAEIVKETAVAGAQTRSRSALLAAIEARAEAGFILDAGIAEPIRSTSPNLLSQTIHDG